MASKSRDPGSSMSSLPDVGLATRSPTAFLQQPTPSVDEERDYNAHIQYTSEDPRHHQHCLDPEFLRNRHRKDVNELDQNISIPASNKHAEMTIAPFLTKHIPSQYNPLGNDFPAAHTTEEQEDLRNNTKYCYRHRPDLKCRRQANEPSMEQLQNELATLTQSDQQAISHVWSLFSAAPAKHRNLMLQGILTQCCFPQLSYISASIRDLIKIDFLAALPAELGYKVLCYLDTASLCRAAQVSQRWRSLADDDVVWHKMCEQHIDRKCIKCGWGLPLLERKRLRKEKRQIQLRATGRGLNQWSPEITPIPEEQPHDSGPVVEASYSAGVKRPLESVALSPGSNKRKCTASSREVEYLPEQDDSYFLPKTRPWKDVYKDRFKVGTAWKHGRCTTTIFKGHTNGVTCLQFDDNVLITGSYDSSIKVWDINTGQELRTMLGHASGIRCLQFDDNKLMTGSLDSTLKLWDWKKGECLRTFNAHSEGIIALHFIGRWVATGSQDRTIRVWDSEKKETFLLRGHTDWINSVRIDAPSRTLFSASDDLTVRLWDLDTKKCIKMFEGHVGQVQQVTLMPVEFELDDGSTFAFEQDDDASSVSSGIVHDHRRTSEPAVASDLPFWPHDADRPAPPKYMLTGSLDSTIRLWNTHYTPTAQPPASSSADALATDPLTNSHFPRAQACVRTFFGHVEGIWALTADHLRLISGSEDRMVKIWDPRTGKCERTFTGHQGPVTCAWLSDSRVASGSEDCEVRMLSFGDA